MAYASTKGRKPFERASKIAHAQIINNPDVDAYLKGCTLPSTPPPMDAGPPIYPLSPVEVSGVRAVVAIDGGFTETYAREEFPSASLTFFTFGPLLFQLEDLRALDARRFIAPEDLAALKKLQRYTLTLPTRGIRLMGESSLASSIRKTIYAFFTRPSGPGEEPLIRTLSWFLFRRWEADPNDSLVELVARCPNPDCAARDISFRFSDPAETVCATCAMPVYLTDVFRLHELVDEEQGAAGMNVYVMTLMEQLVLLHVIRTIWNLKRTLLAEFLFLKDGPLAFFGEVSPLHTPMRDLTRFLMDQPSSGGSGRQSYLYLAGAEKSGAFVDHAAAIESRLTPGSYMLPDNNYIYRYIVPGDPNIGQYGRNTYYGGKVFFRSLAGDMHVLTVPNRIYKPTSTPVDFPNLEAVLYLVGELRCSMYENSLVPVALANKLVSLSDFPSQRILTTFAKQALG